MALFDNSNIKLDVLKKRAFNYRWAEVPDGVIPLTAADPDYPVAPEIQEAMMDYVKDGYFQSTDGKKRRRDRSESDSSN